MNRTFRIDRLYHQLLKPKGAPEWLLDKLIEALLSEGFIHLDAQGERYEETEKLSSGEYRQELHKTVQKVINAAL